MRLVLTVYQLLATLPHTSLTLCDGNYVVGLNLPLHLPRYLAIIAQSQSPLSFTIGGSKRLQCSMLHVLCTHISSFRFQPQCPRAILNTTQTTAKRSHKWQLIPRTSLTFWDGNFVVGLHLPVFLKGHKTPHWPVCGQPLSHFITTI